MNKPSAKTNVESKADSSKAASAANVPLSTLVSKPLGALVASSLRPLLTEAFVNGYMKLSLAEKKDLMDHLATDLNSMNFFEPGVGFSAAQENNQSLVDLSAELSTLVRNLAKVQEPSFAKWFLNVQSDLGARGFSEQPLSARADLLIKFKGVTGSDFFSAGKLNLSPDTTAIAIDEQNFFLLPDHEGIEKSLIGPIFAQKMLLLYCGPLKISDLLEMQDIGTRLLAVDACDVNQEFDVEPYLHGRVTDFAKKNPNVRFIEIHLPSLAWALKANRVKATQTLSVAGVSREMLRRQFGWKSSTFDEDSQSFHIKGEIDAILSYRP